MLLKRYYLTYNSQSQIMDLKPILFGIFKNNNYLDRLKYITQFSVLYRLLVPTSYL